MTAQDLKERSQYQREQWDFIILARDTLMELARYLKEQYSKQDKNKLRDNPKYLIYYTLLQIIYIDNHCKIYQYLKQQANRYLNKMYQPPVAAKYRNTKYIYGWRALKYQLKYLLTV